MKKSQIAIGHSIEGVHPVTLDIPIFVETRAIGCASSGGGKSWLARLIVERAAPMVQTIIIDPEREYATLREKLDIAVAGENGELGVDLRTAGKLARKLMETQISAVIDLFSLNDLEAKREYLALFVESLMTVPVALRHPVLFIVDEAHKFAPEGVKSRSTAALINVMDSGRKRGIGTFALTQRVSKVAKDVIAEAKNVFIGSTTLDLDQDRAGDMLGMHKAERVHLRDLDPGMFYAFGPALGKGIQFFKSDQVETRHPKMGERNLVQVPKASEHIREIVAQIGDLPAQVQEEHDVLESARHEIVDLKRQLAARPKQVETKVERIVEKVEIPIFQEGDLQKLASFIASLGDVSAQTSNIAADLRRAMDAARQMKATPVRMPTPTQPRAVLPARVFNAPVETNGSDLTVPQQRILDALARFESLGLRDAAKNNAAVFADQSPSSSGFTNNLGHLRTLGLIQYPTAGRVALTDAGRERANPPEPIQSVTELHEAWYAKLSRPKVAILSELIAIYPSEIDKTQLAEQANQSASSSGYTNNLGALRSLGLIEYPKPGMVVATELLFPKELR